MLDEELKIRYYIFRCRNLVCKEIIPVKTFSLKQSTSYKGIFLLMAHTYEGLNEDMSSVDAKCPFCRRMYQFHLKDNIKEISKREYEAEIKMTNAKISLMNVITNKSNPVKQDIKNERLD